MRPILALAILLLSLGTASPEPEYSALLTYLFRPMKGAVAASLVDIESSTAKADRKFVAALRSNEPIERPAAETTGLPHSPVPPTATTPMMQDGSPDSIPAFAPTNADSDRAPAVSLDDLCTALLTSAEDNDLPVPFFANLIWQESHLRDDAVSPKGALGIAQFMPKVAVETGLANPLDPLQAIPASARLLRELHQQFGNLGFVAAAYNAGARRVAEWLQRRRALPRETRGYVIHVTGRSVEQWRTTPPDDATLQFVRRLPCRKRPAFAELEQAQLQQEQSERAQAQQARAQETQARRAQEAEKPAAAAHRGRERLADHKRLHTHMRPEILRTAVRNGSGKREAGVRRPPHERRKRA